MTIKPNIIVIMADDMGMGDIHAFGNNDVLTPNIDKLISDGTSFMNHYSASPMCAPARASFLTGKYPHRAGAIDVSTSRGLDRINPEEKLLPSYLKDLGYRTGMVGKWHNGRDLEKYHPLRRGFDEFTGFCLGWMDYWNWSLDKNGKPMKADGRYLTDVFTDESVSFIERNKDNPFFLYLAYNAPHDPLQAHEEDIRYFKSLGKYNTAVSTIYAMIKRMDEGVGKVMSTLKKHNLYENTIILFTSDNGPSFRGKDDMCMKRFNLGFSGSKGDVLEGGIRVPAILKDNGTIDGGDESRKIIHFIDWLPSIYEMAGGTVGSFKGIDGVPISKEKPQDQREFYWQWNRLAPVDGCNMAMQKNGYKLYYPPVPEAVRYLESETKPFREILENPNTGHELNINDYKRKLSKPVEPKLFNLNDDPEEKTDLSMAKTMEYIMMKDSLETWFDKMNDEWEKTASKTIGKASKLYARNK